MLIESPTISIKLNPSLPSAIWNLGKFISNAKPIDDEEENAEKIEKFWKNT